MEKTEKTARDLCRLDLLGIGLPEDEAPIFVEEFWPVLANEIRQGIVDGEWPFSEAEIHDLTKAYQSLLERWRPRMRAVEGRDSEVPSPAGQ